MSFSRATYVNTRPRKPDVFLSFRGEDTRYGFADHLYQALVRAQIKTFFDDHELKTGEDISAALLRAIEASKVSVVICSENYGSSKWCLDELVKILECHKLRDQMVFPVFYKVEPAHVRHQINKFGDAFKGLKHGADRIAGWSAALTKFANLSGLTYVYGYESVFIEKIVKRILDVAGLDGQKKKEDVADQALPPPTKPRLVSTDNPLGQLERICPPGGKDEIILYTTTLGANRNTIQACDQVRTFLKNLGVKFSERDLAWEHEGYLKELRELMKDKERKATVPPRLFVKGRYVGGHEEVFKLVEEGRFRQAVVDSI